MDDFIEPLNGAKPRVYVDQESLFSLHVPKGWLVDTSGQQGSRVILLHPMIENDFRVNVNVVVNAMGGLTIEEYLTLSRLQIKQLTGARQLAVDELARRPEGAHLLEWIVEIAPVPLKIRQVFLAKEPRIYLVTATAPLARFELHRSVLETVLESFHLPSQSQ
jgi:hypothetical protein